MASLSTDAKPPSPLSDARRRRVLAFSFGQLAVGGLLLVIGLQIDGSFLVVIGALLASWFWVPLAMAARHKANAKTRLGYALMAAVVLLAGSMAAAFYLLPETGFFWMLGIGLGGGIWLVVPLLIAWAMAGASGTLPKARGRTGKSRAVAGLGLRIDMSADAQMVDVVIEVGDSKYLGEPAEMVIYRLAEVQDPSPVNDLVTLARQELVLDRGRIELTWPAAGIQGFTYRGEKVSLKTFAELRLADGLFSDTTVCSELQLPEHHLPAQHGDAKLLADPKDAFCLVSNFRVIPLHRKAAVLGLLAIGAVVLAVNSAVGLHDQFAPDGGQYIYPHQDNDGDSQSPLMSSLLLSGGIGAAIWLALRRQLRSYTTFRLGPTPGTIGRETVLAIDKLVHGRPAVDLENARLRVIACNLEKGSYTRGSGSNERTIAFSEPVRAVLLFEQDLPLVRRGQPLEDSLSGSVDFGPVFDLLHPPCLVSKSHGLALQWEVQLLHDRLVDHELVAPPCEYRATDFGVGEIDLREASDARSS